MLTHSQAGPAPVAPARQSRGAGIRHGYFTRIGGVSQGIYRGLNIGTGSADDQALVRENRRRVAAWMGVAADRLLTAYQIHSPDVIVVARAVCRASGRRPTRIVTDRPGIAVGASSADCGPVLFADAEARVVGAAHAGWKGAFTGVLENTVAAMERLGARRENIVAVLGPSISASELRSRTRIRRPFHRRRRRQRPLFRRFAEARPRHVRSQPAIPWTGSRRPA